MKTWLLILTPIYLGILGYLAIRSRQKNKSADDFMLGGSPLGLVIGFMTVAATLFSTFTLMGMPDFFRIHGVGSWLFLAVSDGAMIFMIVWFGYHLRKKAAEKGFNGVGGLLKASYSSPWAGYLYFVGIFIFLIPYVAVQIRGISVFLEAAFPEALPVWGWASLIAIVMLLYSETGGLKAIIYADVMQAGVLMVVVWIIATHLVGKMGGITAMFDQVEAINPALLSVPGPKGLFNVQFLISSMLAILFIPVTQPQVTIRLAIMKDLKTMHRMAVALGCFAMLVILPTIAIGMYGAVFYADLPDKEFWAKALLEDQLPWVAAAAIIGLIAAALSTSDSQVFAMGTELRSLLTGEEGKVLLITRIAIACFAIAALIFSIVSVDQLALVARVSFAGTAMLGPMVLAAVLCKRPPGNAIVGLTAVGLVLFIASILKVIPGSVAGIRMDLLLLVVLGAGTLLLSFLNKAPAQASS